VVLLTSELLGRRLNVQGQKEDYRSITYESLQLTRRLLMELKLKALIPRLFDRN
jgi:hypothetical protein